MKTLIASWNIDAIDEAIERIEITLRCSPTQMIFFRRDLCDRRDDLHNLVSCMANDGSDDEFQEFYLPACDALGMLCLALSGRAVNGRHLNDALTALRTAKERAVTL